MSAHYWRLCSYGSIFPRALSDIDNDGRLTNDEFCLAMHLVDMVRSNQPIPAKLPPNLIPPSFRKGGAVTGGAVGVPPGGLGGSSPPQPVAPAVPLGKVYSSMYIFIYIL